jgi:hypothetical protein
LRISVFLVCLLAVIQSAKARATITWQGHVWRVKSATRSGPGPNNWNAGNVFVDTNGYLHLLITANPASPNGFDCAELSTTENLGFGTYQWQIEGGVDTLDPWVVLGLFPYGPPVLGPDESNEIDIEYSRWGKPIGDNDGFTIYPNSGTTVGHKAFTIALSGTQSTSRFTWNSKGIRFWSMDGFQPIGTTTNVLAAWNYTPENSATNVPQNAMPLHINLWLDKGHKPSNGQPVEIIIRSFVFARE